jgi:hypothetical protein
MGKFPSGRSVKRDECWCLIFSKAVVRSDNRAFTESVGCRVSVDVEGRGSATVGRGGTEGTLAAVLLTVLAVIVLVRLRLWLAV